MGTDVISFRASDVDQIKLKDVLKSHFEYEQARVFRSAVIWRLSTIVLVVWALSRGAHILPVTALTVALLLAGAVVAGVILFELRARSRFLREVSDIPVAS